MKIISIEWRNFNSYGNTTQTIEFGNEGNLYSLVGGNGNGKSTISEVITYSLYGRLEKKTKGDLPNRINKNLWCRIVTKSKGKKVTITRGISPGLFEVDIDGVPYETAGNSNVQEYLEFEIFDIPYQVFKNIIVLSINDFKSFLTMSPGDKRNIVDRLFGFSLINSMKDKIRNERKDIKEKLKTLIDELSILNESIDSINQKIKKVEENKKDENVKLANELKSKLLILIDEKKTIESQVTKIKEKEIEFKNSLTKNKEKLVETNVNSNSVKSQLKLYENSQCPVCKSSLEGEHHHTIKENLETKQKELELTKDELTSIVNDLDGKTKKLSTKVSELNTQVISLGLKINQYKNDITTLVNENKDLDAKSLYQLIQENTQKVTDRKGLQSKNILDDTFLELVESVLGDDGVKNLAMKTILPSLNANISSMAKQIHLPYSIKFDDKFDCIINSLGESINAKSMSTGERKKSDFIIIIALLKILKIRYPSLNLLFLDEIFSSVDSSGIYEIIKILSDVSKQNTLNTWVINHTELPTELFDKKVEVFKEGGFSKIQIETIS